MCVHVRVCQFVRECVCVQDHEYQHGVTKRGKVCEVCIEIISMIP